MRKFQPSTAGVESLAIIPTYKKPWMKEPKAEEKLLQEIEGISRDLNGKLYTGPALLQEKIQNALSDCGHFFYYGHVHYNSELPTHSAVLLNQSAYKDPSLKKPGSEGLTVRDLFKVQLHKPALATLIGCGSGQALISGLDDVLGLPTALLYAGASAIVSTLWSIDVDDGANFAVEFYNAVHQQQVNQKTDGTSADGESGLKSCVNLACAMHEAVKMLRQRGEQEKAAYHWAAFYLTGFWLFPPLAIKETLEIDSRSACGLESNQRGVASKRQFQTTLRSLRCRLDNVGEGFAVGTREHTQYHVSYSAMAGSHGFYIFTPFQVARYIRDAVFERSMMI